MGKLWTLHGFFLDCWKILNIIFLINQFINYNFSYQYQSIDRVAVMYLGQFVEVAPTEIIYYKPKHPYTESLMSAIPTPDPGNVTEPILISGERPDPANPPSGCRFHTRCQCVDTKCKTQAPELVEYDQDHFVACHYAEELQLKGALEQPAAVKEEHI